METGLIEQGRVTIANLMHENWCDIYRGCDRQIEFQPLARPEKVN